MCPLKVAVVEDEAPSRELIKRMLLEFSEVETVLSYALPSEALESLPLEKPDLIILDIEMPVITGIELAKRLRKDLPQAAIAFLTGYKQYAIEAFDVEAIDYLLKPYEENQIKRVIERAMKQGHVESELLVKIQTQIRCFGSFEVINPEGQFVKWSTKKSQELLAYLILHRNQRIDKDRLCDALFPDKPRSKHSNNLNITAYRLRKDLQEHQLSIQVLSEKGSQEGYGISLDSSMCDLMIVDELLETALFSSEEVKYLQMLKRHPLENALFESNDYPWADAAKAYYHRRLMSRQKQRCEALQEGRQWQQLLKEAQFMASCEPYDEQACLYVVEALGELSERNQLIAYKATLENQYLSELGIDLSKRILNSFMKWL